MAPRLAAALVIGVALVMLASAMPQHWSAPARPAAPEGAPNHGGSVGTVTSAGASIVPWRATAPLAATPASSYTENGWAQFFTDARIPNPTAGNNTCLPYTTYWFCWNSTAEPSLNLTSDGYTGLAYTAFTNQSPCPAQSGNATSEIGWVVSTDFGLSWSPPLYLGNPDCTGDPGRNYSSAVDPSLTSLANGTFVLTYIEYNASPSPSTGFGAPPYVLFCGNTQNSRVVVTESYDHGVTWSAPAVIDGAEFDPATDTCPMKGFPDVRPQITAYGETLYLAWSNVSSPLYNYFFGNYAGSAWVNFVASTDGGQSWSSIQHLRTIDGSVSGSTSDSAINPTLTIDASGTVFVAYATEFGTTTMCGTYCSAYVSASVVVARSHTNGSAFAYSKAATHVLVNYPSTYPYVFWDPMPALAYDPVDGQVDLSYVAAQFGIFCDNQGAFGSSCYQQILDKVVFQNSSDGGSSWSTARLVLPINASAPWFSPELNPSMAVDSAGKVHLQYEVLDDSICVSYPPYGGFYCAPPEERYTNSTDNGTSWTAPLLISPEISLMYGPYASSWPGTYTSTLSAGREILFGWTRQECHVLVSPCALPTFTTAPGLPAASTQVTTSQLYESVGLTVTFNETGVPAGQVWSVNVQGNVRDGPAGVNLSVSGVPPGVSIDWNTSWINVSYGIAYSASPSRAPPAPFAANTTIVETYHEQVQVQLLTVPGGFPSWMWAYNYYGNVKLSPPPGSFWVAAGTTMTFNQWYYNTTYAYCFACVNLTFLGWTGTGAGSVSSNASAITFTPTGPVNETASFQLNGVCWGSWYVLAGYPSCIQYAYDLEFEEQGLPTGSTWGVTTTGANGTAKVATGSTISLVVTIGPGLNSFDAWTVPDPATGRFWVPTPSETSPVLMPQTAPIRLDYSLEPIDSAKFPTTFEASGLPNGTDWGLSVGGSNYGMTDANGTFSLSGGASVGVNGSTVPGVDGTGFYVSSILVTPWVVNATPFRLAPGGSFVVNGSSLVVLTYSPMYRLTVTGSIGGTVSPASMWIDAGGRALLGESADSGSHFVGWTGSGFGSYTGSASAPTVSPYGPVAEFATFRPDAPATWNVTMRAVGLPNGSTFSISLGTTTYSGLGSFTVGNLSSGWYATFFPTIVPNASEATRFVPVGVSASLPLPANGSLDVTGNGTVWITYSTQYGLSLAATPGGSARWGASGSVGLRWFNASETVSLLAVPDPGHYFVGWNGTGNGSVLASTPAITLRIDGPLTEVAQFQARPVGPPATFWLQVTESGLPAHTPWSIAVGGVGAAGDSATLTVVGLNGSYGLTAAPIYPSPGVRWVSDAQNANTVVTANGTFSVTFVEQFEVTVLASAGGSVTPAGVQWVSPGAVVELAASANVSSRFLSWTGVGSGNFTGNDSSATVTAEGPITEQASFGPAPSASVAMDSSTDVLLAAGLLVALLLVGLLIGWRLRRRS